ncbi:site-specific integrase [Nocardia gipuzkoensis]
MLFHTDNHTPVTAYHFYKNAWQPALRRLDVLARRDLRLLRNKGTMAWRRSRRPDGPVRSTVRTLSGKVLTPYTLRHTGISWKLQDGVPIFVVSRDAGHESVNTTDRYQVIAGRLPRVRASMLSIAA